MTRLRPVPLVEVEDGVFTHPSTMVVSARLPFAKYAMLEAVRLARGDKTRTETLQAAVDAFLKSHMKEEA